MFVLQRVVVRLPSVGTFALAVYRTQVYVLLFVKVIDQEIVWSAAFFVGVELEI